MPQWTLTLLEKLTHSSSHQVRSPCNIKMTREWCPIGLAYICALIWKPKAGQSFIILLTDTATAASGIKHVTFYLPDSLSNYSFRSHLHYLFTTAQLWSHVSISVYTTLTNSTTATPGSQSTKANFTSSFSGDQTSIWFGMLLSSPSQSCAVVITDLTMLKCKVFCS